MYCTATYGFCAYLVWPGLVGPNAIVSICVWRHAK